MPNMVMLGFKSDWQNDIEGLNGYIDVMHHGFDIHMAMGILRLSKGCDFSTVIGEERNKEIVNDHNEDDEVFTKNGGSQNSEDGKFYSIGSNPVGADIYGGGGGDHPRL